MTRIHFMRDRKPGNIAMAIRLQGTEESFQNPSPAEMGVSPRLHVTRKTGGRRARSTGVLLFQRFSSLSVPLCLCGE
jgi:hypothetical protein